MDARLIAMREAGSLNNADCEDLEDVANDIYTTVFNIVDSDAGFTGEEAGEIAQAAKDAALIKIVEIYSK